MPIYSSSITVQRYLYLAVAVLIALNCFLLWRDYQKEQDRQDLLSKFYKAQVEVLVLKAEKMFGAPYISPFRTVDLKNQPALLPNFGRAPLLLLFFESNHCAACLEAMTSFESVVGDNIQVIGVAQASSVEEIMPMLDEYEFKFPVYLAVDSPFNLGFETYSVLVGQNRNVIYMTSINPTIKPMSEIFAEIIQVIERG